MSKKFFPGYVYLVKCRNFYKIGMSKNAEQRIIGMSVDNPFPIEIITYGFVDSARTIERKLHEKYKDRRFHGEWFFLSDAEVDEIFYYIESIKLMKKQEPIEYIERGNYAIGQCKEKINIVYKANIDDFDFEI